MTKVSYTDTPDDVAEALENAAAIEDFLPFPDQLVLKAEDDKQRSDNSHQ